MRGIGTINQDIRYDNLFWFNFLDGFCLEGFLNAKMTAEKLSHTKKKSCQIIFFYQYIFH